MDNEDSFANEVLTSSSMLPYHRNPSSAVAPTEMVQVSTVDPVRFSRDPEVPSPPPDEKDAVSTDKESGTPDLPIPMGMKLGSKELYREDAESPWDDWSPDDIDIDIEETSEAKSYALIVRREKRVGQKSSLALKSITVQSPLIRKVLGNVFDGYRGMTTKLKDLTFKAPFHEFFYRWDHFQQQITEEKDDLVLEHIRLLQSVISGEIKPHLNKRQELFDNGLVTFDYLWALFEPDAVIYTKSDDQDRLYKLVESSYRKAGGIVFFSLTCRYIDCDGVAFGYVTTSLVLNDFDGIKPTSELSIMPIRLHSQISEIWERLKKRGNSFVELNGFHYKSYSGMCTINEGYFGNPVKRNLDDGRVIIDTKMWSTYNPDETLNLEAFDNPHADIQSSGDEFLSFPPNDSPFDDDHPYVDGHREIQAMGRHTQRRMNRKHEFIDVQARNPTSLTDDQVVLCTPMVRGYCLTSKQWAQFYVESVREIRWNLDAFQRLVLPPDYKELIWALVESQLSHEDGFDDIVQGKGQGIVMLLTGEPGVGKTLTAESVAEEMRKPLYSMSAGELGHTAGEAEHQLQEVLELSAKWGAILLIDECDVFLEQRTTSDLERNELVSVFLRLLEYYKGVMFLTTNRVSTLDAAFQSRIHLTLEYPKLDFSSKMLVWRTFVRPQSDASKYAGEIDEDDLGTLASLDVNGREIKNIVRTAKLLASRKKVPLAMEHVATVLRVKDGASGTGKTRELSGMLALMLLPFRIGIAGFQRLLASFITRMHRTDVARKKL